LILHKGFTIILLTAIIAGCGATPHTAKVSWESGKVRFDFTPASGIGTPVLECVSCSGALPPLPLEVNNQGTGYIKFDELKTYLAEHFHVRGSGIDTTLTLSQPQPDEAMQLYNLQKKLIGRIMISRYANLYKDSTMSERIGSLDRLDEVNLFAEGDLFYHIHDPRYAEPVVVLKSHAVRIQ
jgi:hypothetical protein